MSIEAVFWLNPHMPSFIRKEAKRMGVAGRRSVRPGRLERKRRSRDSHLRSLTGAPRHDPVAAARRILLLALRPHHRSDGDLGEQLDHGGLLTLADLVDPHPQRLRQQLRRVERVGGARTTRAEPHMRTRALVGGERPLDVATHLPIGTLLNQHEHKQLLAHRRDSLNSENTHNTLAAKSSGRASWKQSPPVTAPTFHMKMPNCRLYI